MGCPDWKGIILTGKLTFVYVFGGMLESARLSMEVKATGWVRCCKVFRIPRACPVTGSLYFELLWMKARLGELIRSILV